MNQTQEPITTDVPLGLDERNTVWDAGCVWYKVPALHQYPLGCVPVFLTREDVEQFKVNFPPDRVVGEPMEFLFESAMALARQRGLHLLVVRFQRE